MARKKTSASKKKVSSSAASSSAASTTRKPFRILSLDGGGIRGIITAKWLEALEEETGKPAANYFDLIAGTSTGSILASAVAMQIPARDIVNLYVEKGKVIFAKSSWGRWFQRVLAEGVDGPKYDGEGLAKTLQSITEDKTFGSLSKNVMITAYDTANRTPLIFKSWREEYHALPLWEVIKSSCSAPTFFPGHKMRMGRYDLPLIDGGVVANNPSACALAEGIRMLSETDGDFRLSQVRLLSLGTGELTRPITIEDTQEWGKLEWAIPIIDVLFDGAGDAVNYQCAKVLGDEKYMRLQCRLDEGYDEMDNADLTNLKALMRVADKYLDTDGRLDQLVDFVK